MSMPDWLTAAEIADMALPGLPASKRGVLNVAGREGWRSKPRESGRGGGYLYAVSSLPRAARQALRERLIDRSIGAKPSLPAPNDDAPPMAVEDLTTWQREVMRARAAILAWIDEHGLMHGQDRVIRRLVSLGKAGQLPPDIATAVPLANAKSGRQSGKPRATLSRATLYTWLGARREHGVAGLAPKLSSEADMSIPAWAPALLDLYRKPSKPSLAAVMADLPKELPEGVAMPSYDQAWRFLGKLSAVTRQKGRMGPQALKSLKAYVARDTSHLWPGAVFTADGHTFKATVEHPFHGQPFRPEVTTVLDVATRYATGWSIGLSENALGVLEALSHAMIRKDDGRKGAVPAIWYTDRGGGFVNEMLGGEAIGFHERWGITAKQSLPYNSQARGIIERFQRVWVKAAKSLASYQGRDMDKEAARHRKRITDAALKDAGKAPFDLTWKEFKAFAQDKIDEYNATPHSGLPRVRDPRTKRYRHMTPTEAWEAWEADGGQVTLIEPEDAADLWRPHERRRVARCEVRVLGNRYFSLDLEAHHGEDVLVGYDIHDGSRVFVRDFKGRLLAVAEVDGNSRPYFDDATLDQAVSFQRRRHEERVKGRLRRVDRKREEVLAEVPSIAARAIDHQPAPPLDPATARAAAAMFARLEDASERPCTDAAANGDRPKFRDELTWAKWVASNPRLATEKDKALLRTALRRQGFTQILQIEGVELSTLKSLAA